MNKTPESLKLLFVGNSFAVDTMEHTANIALSLGIKSIKFGTLYVGGCSIDMHHNHAYNDMPVYKYYVNTGDGWSSTPEYKRSDAIKSDDWDWIAIQHGTKNGSRYTSPECYEKLDSLIDYIKELAPEAKIAFNMTWLGEPTKDHHEIISYGGDMVRMREELCKVKREVILTNPRIDKFIPTGTAIENARTSRLGILTRDGYHLSYDKGRFIAGLALISTIADLDVTGISWAPEGVDEYARLVAIESAKNAMKFPLEITQSKLI